jgi:hypothetical protein
MPYTVKAAATGPRVAGDQRFEHAPHAAILRCDAHLEQRILVGHLHLQRQHVECHGLQLLQQEGEHLIQPLRLRDLDVEPQGEHLV